MTTKDHIIKPTYFLVSLGYSAKLVLDHPACLDFMKCMKNALFYKDEYQKATEVYAMPLDTFDIKPISHEEVMKFKANKILGVNDETNP